MRARFDRLLLAIALLGGAVSAYLALSGLELLPAWEHAMEAAFVAAGLTALSLQLLLCRRTRLRWQFLPALLLLLAAGAFRLGLSLATGWDRLGWLILLLFCIPPPSASPWASSCTIPPAASAASENHKKRPTERFPSRSVGLFLFSV